MPRRKYKNIYTRSGLSNFLRRPAVQFGMLLFIALVIFLLALVGSESKNSVPREISVDEAYQMYQNGAFVLDVSWPAEWEEYHAPDTTNIPLDQLYNRLNELPRDREVLVVSRSQTSSQEARDLLLSAGIKAVSMAGSMSEWFAKGYPIEGAPPQ